jgi:hypothetical protein
MEHAQREAALRAGDLVVIELHGIDGPAAEFVVLRIGPEDRTQQDASATSLWVSFHMIHLHSVSLSRVLRGDLGYTLQNYYMRPKHTPKNKIVRDEERVRNYDLPNSEDPPDKRGCGKGKTRFWAYSRVVGKNPIESLQESLQWSKCYARWCCKVVEKSGAPERSRTSDLLVRSWRSQSGKLWLVLPLQIPITPISGLP